MTTPIGFTAFTGLNKTHDSPEFHRVDYSSDLSDGEFNDYTQDPLLTGIYGICDRKPSTDFEPVARPLGRVATAALLA